MTRPHRLERRKVKVAARALAEARRWRRVALPTAGRMLLPTGREVDCTLVDISPGGVSVQAPIPPQIGTRVVLMIAELGRLEVHVERHITRTVFAGPLLATARKRDRLGDIITWMVNKAALGLDEDRDAKRAAERGDVTVSLADGVQFVATLIDVSRTGVAVETLERPRLGEKVHVDGAAAEVTRLLERGFAVEFLAPEGGAGAGNPAEAADAPGADAATPSDDPCDEAWDGLDVDSLDDAALIAVFLPRHAEEPEMQGESGKGTRYDD